MLLCILCILYFFTTVTQQCAPHSPSPWTKTTHVNNHHHHQTVENFYLDNRTIYHKIIEIEKRIERIEEKENNVLPEPSKPNNPVVNPPVSPIQPKTDPEQSENDCLSCPSLIPILDSCENCVSVKISPPFEYYSCKAVELKCGDGAKKLKISDGFQKNIHENNFKLICKNGSWMMMANHAEHKVETITCLTN
ncbi:uncharacterized protein CELE_ZK688.1 [Caenorhabditis elegans]|uniref:Uncharacterized protein ZK688.1 n=1 Tax=Caenorhabditis elegans TaxID=6239 RepID=YO21_CAEEL|nr:Uncharacterized protein CELE_ZK688.1 [Caenorhabditis elegans]P34671.2 RecName: Full=Uncharacterized protein ZK688.1 [Caenorhabditis elegans]CCD62532.1 Uncharacterized protein CELE_ZK688.1 [Caenorhabditis elegans]|eukprot:NP_498720.1 Uncharacterized protein CELE_ZK688.1 [Caenorhabditis elegans]